MMLPAAAMLYAQTDTSEVVITGTLTARQKSLSPVAVDVFNRSFFQGNPSPALFENLGMINGVRPQYNCNVCSAGDIHINGMEGPYTMVLIDGMPLLSSLGTVYGLTGLPMSIVERVEVMKGPAASIYGSESMGGIINIITRKPLEKSAFSAEASYSSWHEQQLELSWSGHAGRHRFFIAPGINRYAALHDLNRDGFTDMAPFTRLTLPFKWEWSSKSGHSLSFFSRVMHEERWGGQTNWTRAWRGTDSIYGENIITRRMELIGKARFNWQLPVTVQSSLVTHGQQSWYGTTNLNATQRVGFVQVLTEKKTGRHELMAGLALRHTNYDDNTVVTESGGVNKPDVVTMPGLFAQDEWQLNSATTLLAGYRFDYHSAHGGVHSPRLAFRFKPDLKTTLRINAGTGFRVVNVFTEEHAALTGARQVVLSGTLKPERSVNLTLQGDRSFSFRKTRIKADAAAWHTGFSNKIIPDYDTDPDKIIYNNLDGFAVSQGVSLSLEAVFAKPLTLQAAASYMEVYSVIGGQREVQQLAPAWSGNFSARYRIMKTRTTLDLSGQWYGPMRLPVLPNDFRPEWSPWYCLLQATVSQRLSDAFEFYISGKNLLNFVPRNPLMRPWDPFDKQINDPVNNPNGYTFDAGYNYAPLQGRRVMAGIRWNF